MTKMQQHRDACRHTSTIDLSEHCYTGSVAVPPYTREEPAAAGNIRVSVRCQTCGALRHENRNQGQVEMSPWGEPAHVRRDQAQHALDEAQATWTLAAPPAPTVQVRVLAMKQQLRDSGIVLVEIDGHTRTYHTSDLHAPAGAETHVTMACEQIRDRALRALAARWDLDMIESSTSRGTVPRDTNDA